MQAFVTEGVKPLIDVVMTFGAGHFYVSQSDKGGLVFGGDIEGYNSYAQRGNLPVVEDVCEGGMALMPVIGRLRILRSWGGLLDMTMDGSPIIDFTPVEGLYLNGGWCYGGFKATPASGWCFAHLIANDEPHPDATAFRLDRFARGARHRREGHGRPAQSALRRQPCASSCPYCGERALEEFTYRGDATVTRPTSLEPSAEQAWVDYVYLRDNPAGLHREHWHHSARLPCLAGGDPRHDHPRDHSRRIREQRGLEHGASLVRNANRIGAGGLIDRTRTLSFTFDGEELAGHPGDTLASALLANGVRLVGRSFKYHRPRGILTRRLRGAERARRARTGARREPNTRATTIELYDGLDADEPEPLALAQARPARGEPALRPHLRRGLLLQDLHVAGLVLGEGLRARHPPRRWPRPRRRPLPTPTTTRRRTPSATCSSSAAGPAGLSAALAAARSGARVILCEEDFRLGGRLLAERSEIDGRPALDWVTAAKTELESLPDCRIMRRTTVFGVYDGGTYAAVERVNDHVPVPLAHEPRQRLWRIVAKRAVLAAGAIERPIVFGDNDRPGVMLAGAVRTYVNRFGVAPGTRAVVFADNDDAFRTALDLADAGVEVAALVDARRGGSARCPQRGRAIAGALSRRRR